MWDEGCSCWAVVDEAIVCCASEWMLQLMDTENKEQRQKRKRRRGRKSLKKMMFEQ